MVRARIASPQQKRYSATATDLSAASSFRDTAWNSTWALNGDMPCFSRIVQTQDELLAWAELEL